MIKSDEQGNLFTFSDNDGYFDIKGLPLEGSVVVTINGEDKITKQYPSSDVVRVSLTNEEIESIGCGCFNYYVDHISDGHKDTVISQTITISERE